MIGKYFYGALAVAILIAASMTTFAQVGELRGKVMMKQADGQTVPLADAQIDVFRTDMKGSYKTTTNKKGEFVFAGIPFVGIYTVVASHPTAAPNWVDGAKAGQASGVAKWLEQRIDLGVFDDDAPLLIATSAVSAGVNGHPLNLA